MKGVTHWGGKVKLGFESSGMSGRAKEVFNTSERSGKGGGMTLEATNIFFTPSLCQVR